MDRYTVSVDEGPRLSRSGSTYCPTCGLYAPVNRYHASIKEGPYVQARVASDVSAEEAARLARICADALNASEGEVTQ